MSRGGAILCGWILWTLVSCGGGGSAKPDAGSLPSDAVSSDTDTVERDATSDAGPLSTRDVKIILGARAFNEPLNAGYVRDVVPTWHTDDLTISSIGQIAGSMRAAFAGNAPTSDEHRDVLFWNVTGLYLAPPTGDVFRVSLSDVDGVVASASPDPVAVVFRLAGSHARARGL